MEESFARVETKYLLTAAQASAVAEGLRQQGFRRADFGSPRVQSLYYDTEDHALIRASGARRFPCRMRRTALLPGPCRKQQARWAARSCG